LAHTVPARLTPAEGRKFALTVGIAFAVLGGISYWRGHSRVGPTLAALGGLLLLAGVVVPGRLGPVQRAWMGLAMLLSKVTTPIFMGVVYFVVLAPIGLIRRGLGKNALVVPESSDGGFWISRADTPPAPLTRQF